MLELDYHHRMSSPLSPALRARLRWVVAHTNRCAYGEAQATADLLRAGKSATDVRALASDLSGLPEPERAALTFTRQITQAAHAVTDEQIAHLVRQYGDRQVVAMVLLLAYANFQDRLLLTLRLPTAANEPFPPLRVRFAHAPLGADLTAPRPRPAKPPVVTSPTQADAEWRALDHDQLRRELELQRARRPRIPLPAGQDGSIHWGAVCRSYQPQLAAAWSACTQTFGREANQDPVFEASLFWVVTRAQRSFY
jgi:hypothetical protein